MSFQPPSKGWNVLGAVFLIVGGLLLVAICGTCSHFLGSAILGPDKSMWPLLLILLGTLAAGFSLIYRAVRLLRR